ncbi:MAG: hypothetical protein WDM81_03180 [Rhizomicrobium sp.]
MNWSPASVPPSPIAMEMPGTFLSASPSVVVACCCMTSPLTTVTACGVSCTLGGRQARHMRVVLQVVALVLVLDLDRTERDRRVLGMGGAAKSGPAAAIRMPARTN